MVKNKQIGSDFNSLFEELGEKEEISKLTTNKIKANMSSNNESTQEKQSKPVKKSKKTSKKKKTAKKKVTKKSNESSNIEAKDTQGIKAQIQTQKELLKDLGVDLDNTSKTSKNSTTAQIKKQESEPPKKEKKLTIADQIWDSIKDEKLEIYALSNQKVSDHAERVQIAPEFLHLKLKSPAVLPPLEEVILQRAKVPANRKIEVEFVSDYLVVSTKWDI